MVDSDCSIFYKVIRITVKVPSIRIALSIGSLNGKNCVSEGHPRFLSILPLVNLRIKSIVLIALMSNTIVHSINKKLI